MSPEFQLFIGNKCFSSWSLRPWVALYHFGIPFAETVIRLRTPETAANLAKISPTGQVPEMAKAKSPLSLPVTLMLLIVKDALPMFFSATVWAALVTPIV